MKVFLFHISYHKSEWKSRSSWYPIRILAENLSEATDKFWKSRKLGNKGSGFRLDSIEEVTGRPHEIKPKTSF